MCNLGGDFIHDSYVLVLEILKKVLGFFFPFIYLFQFIWYYSEEGVQGEESPAAHSQVMSYFADLSQYQKIINLNS